MVVAIVALIVALGGTAIAGGFITKKKAKKIAANQVNKLAPGLSVASAKNADNATNADTATRSAGPVAWAHVSDDGDFLDGNNVAQGNITFVGGTTFTTCFHGLSFSPRGVIASTDYWNGTQTFSNYVQVGLASSGGIGGTGCPAGTQAFTKARNASNDTASDAAIYIMFFN
jgi:hypothetical protein